MGFDSFFSSSTKGEAVVRRGRRGMGFRNDAERMVVVNWVTHLAAPIGDWEVSFDATFGWFGSWEGRSNGRRRDVRDFLSSQRHRGFDGDDALQLFRKFMARVVPHATWIAAAEPNPDHTGGNPGFHLHAMLAGVGDVMRTRVEKLWVEENGWAKVLPIRNLQLCSDYCTKHLVRRGLLLEWNYGTYDLWRRHLLAERATADLGVSCS